jgi:hypothetical protein
MIEPLVHWWLPGVAPCGAQIGQEFTGHPGDVTCESCLAYVRSRLSGSGKHAGLGIKVAGLKP